MGHCSAHERFFLRTTLTPPVSCLFTIHGAVTSIIIRHDAARTGRGTGDATGLHSVSQAVMVEVNVQDRVHDALGHHEKPYKTNGKHMFLVVHVQNGTQQTATGS